MEFPGIPSSAIKLVRNKDHGDSPPSIKTAKKNFNCVPLPIFTCLVLVPDKERKFIEL